MLQKKSSLVITDKKTTANIRFAQWLAFVFNHVGSHAETFIFTATISPALSATVAKR
jgi:hypothetical protein